LSLNNHRESKDRLILIRVTSKEVDAMEDGLFCHNSAEWYEENWDYMASIWKKVATEFDSKGETLSETLQRLLNEILLETVSHADASDRVSKIINFLERI